MNPESPSSATSRARRIHDLERIADDQRENLRAAAATLTTEFSEIPVVRAVTMGVACGRKAASVFSGGAGGFMDIVSGFFTSSEESGSRAGRAGKIAWKTALNLGLGLLSLYRWWSNRRR